MLSFAGASYSPKTGDAFKLGTLTYHNGATLADSSIGAVDLDIALRIGGPDGGADSHASAHTQRAAGLLRPAASSPPCRSRRRGC
jgi:hypothetical protein